jgi:hypothetical protein
MLWLYRENSRFAGHKKIFVDGGEIYVVQSVADTRRDQGATASSLLRIISESLRMIAEYNCLRKL